jgi:hypothetical protein
MAKRTPVNLETAASVSLLRDLTARPLFFSVFFFFLAFFASFLASAFFMRFTLFFFSSLVSSSEEEDESDDDADRTGCSSRFLFFGPDLWLPFPTQSSSSDESSSASLRKASVFSW